VTANTNIKWYGQRIDEAGSWNKVFSATPTVPVSNDQIVVPVTVRPWDKASSWSDTTVYIRAGYDAILPGIPAHAEADIPFTREGYTISSVSNPGDLGYGPPATVTLNVTTNAPTYTIAFRIQGTDTIVGSETSSSSTVTVLVAANKGTTDRKLEIINGITGEVYHTISQQWSPPGVFFYATNVTSGADLSSRCPNGYSFGASTSVQMYQSVGLWRISGNYITFWEYDDTSYKMLIIRYENSIFQESSKPASGEFPTSAHIQCLRTF
jgi:hypothetical protein